MPSETANTRSSFSNERVPCAGNVSAPFGLDAKAMSESSLRALREPL
jgi:hypothetical protein